MTFDIIVQIFVPQPDTGYESESLSSFYHSHKSDQPVVRGQSVVRDKVLCCAQKYVRGVKPS